MNDEITPDRSGHVEVGGQRVWWEYHGDGTREAACLLNGLAMSTLSWYNFLPRLSDEYDVLLFDYPGQGQSSRDDVPYSIESFAHGLALIMDEVGQRKVHLMGISYGGFIALEFARLYQQRLHTLLLSGILLSHEKLFEMYEDISLRFYRGSKEVFEVYTHYMYEKIFGEAFISALPDEQIEVMRQRFYDLWVDYRHCLIRLTEAQDAFFGVLDDNLEGFRAIRTPTLMIVGGQDRAIPLWQQKKICDVIPGTRWEEIDGSGHIVYLEKPDDFFGMMRAFCKAKSVAF